ncbi:unknown [Phocaeicola coprocola CAG:162]|uniref:Uncharacterized protein n=1 Tax=Phocaeicola coprocola CAG:162 TaxID=1263040 RepID=R6CDF1_9BACT|nr:unknown [Phocaeicola coprocola CAG:162]
MINRFTYNVICQINGRTHGSNCNTDDIFPDQLFSYLINKLLTLEMHYPHSYISSQTDKNRINKIKVKSSQEIKQVACCQSKSGSTKRRHQRRSNGNSRNHVSFFFCSQCYNTSQTTYQSNKHIIDSR